MAQTASTTILPALDKCPLEYEGCTNPYLRPDPYSIPVLISGYAETISGIDRFALVSSLYGPGNLLCWFFLLLSVMVSWTLHPKHAKRDTITNDFIAALSLPLVAAAHFIHQIYQHTSQGSIQHLFTNLERDNVRNVAAIEAPLTVCEDFITWGAILFLLAARKRQWRRASLALVVHGLCFATELILVSGWVPWRSSILLRPFLFHFIPFLGVLICCFGFTTVIYLVEVVWGIWLGAANKNEPEIESGMTVGCETFMPGRISSGIAGCVALVAAGSTFWAKYFWMYAMAGNSMRFAPRSTANVLDLDQIVTATGGFLALLFSLHDALKERREIKRVAEAEERQQQRAD
jgi:hypothetical protein